MSVRSLNWLKFGGLVGLAFLLGLLFAGLLDLPSTTAAQNRNPDAAALVPAVQSTVPVSAAQPLTALSDAFATVAEEVRPSVVFIRSRRTERAATRRLPPGVDELFGFRQRGRGGEPQVETGSGSGFVVSGEGYILTNAHVVDGADEVMVRLIDRHEFKAKIIGVDQNTDIAVIKIEPRGVQVTPARLGSSAGTRVGEWVLAVGNPLQEALSFTVTSGIVSAKGRGSLPLPGTTGTVIQDFIQTDAAINRGNSGGPLLNVRGEVIGINSAIFSQTGFNVGYAFAIPIDLARQVMDQLIAHGKVERAALGVLVGEATQLDADYVKLPEIRGVRINEFSPGSPAKAAGLEEGDVIITVDGESVEYVAQLQQLVGFKKAGSVVNVEVARKGGARRTYKVRLMAQGDAEELASREADGEPESPADETSAAGTRLGVDLTPMTAEMARDLDLPSGTRGVIVSGVDPYGPADGLLFPPGQGAADVITAIEGKPVRNEADLAAGLKVSRAGDIVSLTVYSPAANAGRGASRVVRLKVKE